ncbi:MAG: helix-turn-helix transcriptional regulator [Pseudonocardiaceae bacterium]
MADDFGTQVRGVSALAEPARRALYLYVVSQAESVSRDQAAEGAGLPRHTAKFHLDKLVDEGLLETEFRRLSGRRGPGAGHPTKLYRRSERQLTVTLPERHYDLAGHILARALEDAARDGVPVLDTLRRAATDAGRTLGAHPRTPPEERGQEGASAVHAVADALAEQGYEPRIQAGALVLANCPFHALAGEHSALVCGMNLDLITAMLDELGYPGVEAKLDPAPGRCCVTLVSI